MSCYVDTFRVFCISGAFDRLCFCRCCSGGKWREPCGHRSARRPLEGERQAANELVEHIRVMSGAELPVITEGEDTDGLLPILIGAAADDGLAEKVMQRQAEERPHWEIDYRLKQGEDTFAFALWAEEGAIQLRGGMGHEGTRTAAYELLEQLGVRWYMPGKYGRVIPEKSTIALSLQQTIQVPSFVNRTPPRRCPCTDYIDRSRLGGLGRRHGRHGFPKPDGMNHRQLRDKHPEYYALCEDGERGGRQLCVSNPYVIELVARAIRQRLDADEAPSDTRRIIHGGPHDGTRLACMCEDCRALDPPDYVTTPLATPLPSWTDRYVWFINRVLEELEDDY